MRAYFLLQSCEKAILIELELSVKFTIGLKVARKGLYPMKKY